MSVVEFELSSRIVSMTCGECGIVFGMPSTFQKERKETGGTWYCPNGHPRVYRERDVDALKRQLAEKDKQLAFERQRAATNYAEREKAERKLSKIRRRTSGGVCPCCNRSFVALARHMKTKHADFVESSK